MARGVDLIMASSSPKIFSYTALATYAHCPRQYQFRYIDAVAEDFVSVESHLGHAVHATLAWLYEMRSRGEMPALDEVVHSYWQMWRRQLSRRVRVVRPGLRLADYSARGEKLLRRYFEGEFQADRLETLNIEWSFRLPIAAGLEFTGIVDRLARTEGGELRVIDYKTTSRPPAEMKPEAALQLHGYAAGVLHHRGGERVHVSIHYLEDGSSFVEELDTAATTRVVRELERRIRNLLAATAYPARPTPLCRWCGYRARCEDGRRYLAGTADAASSSCPECGALLELRQGSFGVFVGCSAFPACRFRRAATDEERAHHHSKEADAKGEAMMCPLCGGRLVRRSGRRGDFLGCDNFPACRFTRGA
ncbi:MAG: PD-(D/E)XK nuclease family protein [Planctomycetota bacterium]